MPNLVIYAPQFKAQSGTILQPCLKICADNRFSYYKPYTYFASHLSTKRPSRMWPGFNEASCNEQLARTRRVIGFADTSGLQPVRFSKKHFKDLLDRTHKGMRCDHVTFWKSFWGTSFILNEPYRVNTDYINRLNAQGLVVIEIPVNISPYCGSWNVAAGSLPWSRSFLICDASDEQELLEIQRTLSAQISVAWNSLQGISHV